MLLSLVLAIITNSAFAQKGEQWLTDMDKAQKVAKAEGKDIFMFFTGSDWCGWCIKLDKEVLDKPEFLEYAKKNLILVDLDFPYGDDIISEEQRAHNDAWKGKMPVRGYPTVILTDASAQAYASTGYQAGGPTPYVDHLKALSANKEVVNTLKDKAANATGMTRARLLDELLKIKDTMLVDRNAVMAEIVKLSEGKDEALYNAYRNKSGAILMMEELVNLNGSANPEDKLPEKIAIFEKYNYVKDAQSMGSFLNSLCRTFNHTGKASEGVTFFGKKAADMSYPVETRQVFSTFQELLTLKVKSDNASGVTRARLLDELIKAGGAKLGKRNAMIEEIVNLTEGKDESLYNVYRNKNGAVQVMDALRKLNRSAKPADNLSKMIVTFEKYNYVKDAQSLSSFLQGLSQIFRLAGKADEGVTFFSKKAADMSYPVETRQIFVAYQGILVAESGDVATAKALIEKAASMVEGTMIASSKIDMLSQIDQIASRVSAPKG